MKRVMDVIARFFVRLWFMHRNQMIVKAHKCLGKALAQREEILASVPEKYRQEIVENDPLLTEAKNMAYKLSIFFNQVGVSYEK